MSVLIIIILVCDRVAVDRLKVGIRSYDCPLGIGEIGWIAHSTGLDGGKMGGRWEGENKLFRKSMLCLTGCILPHAQHGHSHISTVSPSDARQRAVTASPSLNISYQLYLTALRCRRNRGLYSWYSMAVGEFHFRFSSGVWMLIRVLFTASTQ